MRWLVGISYYEADYTIRNNYARAWEWINAKKNRFKCFTRRAFQYIAVGTVCIIVMIPRYIWYLSTIIFSRVQKFRCFYMKERIESRRAACLLLASTDYQIQTSDRISRKLRGCDPSRPVFLNRNATAGSRIVSIAAMRCPQWIEAWATRFLKASLSLLPASGQSIVIRIVRTDRFFFLLLLHPQLLRKIS